MESREDYAALGRQYVDLIPPADSPLGSGVEEQSTIHEIYESLLDTSAKEEALTMVTAAIRQVRTAWECEVLGSGWVEELLERQPSWFGDLIDAMGPDDQLLRDTIAYVWLGDVARWLVPRINRFMLTPEPGSAAGRNAGLDPHDT